MRTFVCFPPLAHMTGGMTVLAILAAQLHAAGRPVLLVPREPLRGLVLPPETRAVPVCAWDAADPQPGDVWLVPEGWPGLLLPGLRCREQAEQGNQGNQGNQDVRGARVTLYVQNWAYFLSSLPPGVPISALPLTCIAVSRPVAAYIARHTGQAGDCIPVLRPGIDRSLFCPSAAGGLSPLPAARGGSVRIAWMPRKNKALAVQIQDMVNARLSMAGKPSVEWVEIHRRTQPEVAELLRSCDVFLASGFPEGCPLPPLEAMACGCLVVGFSGFGGLEYMRQAWPGGEHPFPVGGLRPEFAPMDPVPEHAPGNGFWVHDADTIGAAMAVEYALDLLRSGDAELERVRQAGLETADLYGVTAQRAALLALWDTLFGK